MEGNVRVDRLVGLEVERDLLLLALIRKDHTDEKHEPVRGHTVIQFETLLRRSNSGEY